jgi:hypothetical protein
MADGHFCFVLDWYAKAASDLEMAATFVAAASRTLAVEKGDLAA